MAAGRFAAEAAAKFVTTGDVRVLRQPRRRFMKEHGRVFMILGIMQWFWYSSDKRREKFVSICRDKDVQRLTWEAYMNKKLVRSKPVAHAKIFFKDLAHLFGVVDPLIADSVRARGVREDGERQLPAYSGGSALQPWWCDRSAR